MFLKNILLTIMKEFSFEKYFKTFKIIDKKILNKNIKKLKKRKIIELNSLVYYKNEPIVNKILNKEKIPRLIRFDEKLYILFIKDSIKKNQILIDQIYHIKDIYPSIYSNIINNIDNIFNNMNTLPDITLYRGIKYSKKENKNKLINTISKKNNINIDLLRYLKNIHYVKSNKINFKIKQTFTTKDFMSTSMNMKVAYNFSKDFMSTSNLIIFKINIKEKDKIPFIFLSDVFWNYIENNKDLKKLNKWKNKTFDEFEILLPRNIEFKIEKIEEIKILDSVLGFQNYYKKTSNRIVKLIHIKPVSYNKSEKFKLDYCHYNLIF